MKKIFAPLIGIILVIIGYKYYQGSGGTSPSIPSGGDPSQYTDQAKTSIVDFMASPMFPKVVASGIIATVAVMAWNRLPRLRYVIIGAAVVVFLFAAAGKM